jgi:hypothetical protein
MRSRRLGVTLAVIVVVIIAAAMGFGGRLEQWLLRLHGIH